MRVPLQPPSSSRIPWGIPLVVGVVVGGLVLWRTLGWEPATPSPGSPLPSANASVSAAAPTPPRCVEVSAEPFLIGVADPPMRRTTETSDGGDGDDEDSPLVPYAVEVGRGAAFDEGFAMGVTRDEAGGAVTMIATVGLDGRDGRLVRLGRSRGDLDPPVVAASGKAVFVAVTEPNAGGRAIKVAKLTGSEVTWGPEVSEGRDDSLAVDLAASGARAVLVWDDVRGTGEERRNSSILLASFDVGTMRSVTVPHPVSPPKTDASSPRVILRPGGYWLAYLVRGEDDGKKKPVGRGEDEEDDIPQGEAILPTWVEIVPLDEAGNTAALPRSVTSRKGHAASFDIQLANDGSALVLVRDDDTPIGAAGGKLSIVLVGAGGVQDSRVVAEESHGAGIPSLVHGWVVVASGTGATQIAPVGPHGEVLDELGKEPSLGSGQPIASKDDRILWARPLGKGIALTVVKCAGRIGGAPDAAP